MKKVVQLSNGMWHCSKCNGDSLACEYRYILKLDLHDHTGNLPNATAFDVAATALIGLSAKDLFFLSIEPTFVHDIQSAITSHQFLLTFSIKQENFNDVDRVKVTIVNSKSSPTPLLPSLSSQTYMLCVPLTPQLLVAFDLSLPRLPFVFHFHKI